MPVNSGLHLVLDQLLHQVRTDDVLAEALLLEQFEMSQRRAGIRQVLEVRRPRPVLQVGEVGDKGGLREELLGGEVVEIERVREGLDELEGTVSIRMDANGLKDQAAELTSSSISKRVKPP